MKRSILFEILKILSIEVHLPLHMVRYFLMERAQSNDIQSIAGPLWQVINNNGHGTISSCMSQAGFKLPPVQSHASYDTSALHPSHHTQLRIILFNVIIQFWHKPSQHRKVFVQSVYRSDM